MTAFCPFLTIAPTRNFLPNPMSLMSCPSALLPCSTVYSNTSTSIVKKVATLLMPTELAASSAASSADPALLDANAGGFSLSERESTNLSTSLAASVRGEKATSMSSCSARLRNATLWSKVIVSRTSLDLA